MEIVSREFRKQRLEPWAAGRGPDPSFAAMVFWCCDRVRQENTSKLAGGRRRAGKSPSLELISRGFRKQRLFPNNLCEVSIWPVLQGDASQAANYINLGISKRLDRKKQNKVNQLDEYLAVYRPPLAAPSYPAWGRRQGA